MHETKYSYLDHSDIENSELIKVPIYEIIKLIQIQLQNVIHYDYSYDIETNHYFLCLYANSPAYGVEAFNQTTFKIA